MGYTTKFRGKFALSKPLTAEHAAYLHAFADTRRMARNSAITATYPDPLRLAVDLPVGEQGGYFVNADAFGKFAGQARTADILNFNHPPAGQPGLWCQWVPSKDNKSIEWDGGEKFYEYEAWLRYIVENFLKRWGYSLSGRVKWQGEDMDDSGVLVATDNVISTEG